MVLEAFSLRILGLGELFKLEIWVSEAYMLLKLDVGVLFSVEIGSWEGYKQGLKGFKGNIFPSKLILQALFPLEFGVLEACSPYS